MTKEEWNKIINNNLLQVKPIKLRIQIADKFFNMLNKKDEKIAELEREVEELKDQSEIWHKLLFEKMETQIIGVTKEKMQQIRHEICEEIRKKATFDDSDPFFYRPIYHITPKLLDQIEKGE